MAAILLLLLLAADSAVGSVYTTYHWYVNDHCGVAVATATACLSAVQAILGIKVFSFPSAAGTCNSPFTGLPSYRATHVLTRRRMTRWNSRASKAATPRAILTVFSAKVRFSTCVGGRGGEGHSGRGTRVHATLCSKKCH